VADLPEVAHLLDIPLEVEAVVDGPVLRVSELLSLSVGSVIATSLAAGENIDIFAGKAYIGAGELTSANSHSVVRMVKFKSRN
jgi:flagellar motor switch/type III secretory pathway protein FliN